MTDRYPSAYQKALDKNREDDKKTEKRREFKVKVSSYFKSEKKEPENVGVRTGNPWKRPSLRERMKMPSWGASGRPGSVVKVMEELQKNEDASLTEQKRRDALDKAEMIIMNDPKMLGIANNTDYTVFGGGGQALSPSEKRNAEKFVSRHLRKYPGANENRQYNHTIARFMIAKNRHYYNIVKNNGALRDYETMRRKYGK